MDDRKHRYDINKLGKRLRRDVGRAIGDYGLIDDGDRVMVCLSGGKDSYTLLDVLLSLKRAAPIAGTAKNTVHDFLFTETLVEAITSDPGFNKGFYSSPSDVREGMLRHAKMWAVMGWSTEFFQQNRHKLLGFSSSDFFSLSVSA